MLESMLSNTLNSTGIGLVKPQSTLDLIILILENEKIKTKAKIYMH